MVKLDRAKYIYISTGSNRIERSIDVLMIIPK